MERGFKLCPTCINYAGCGRNSRLKSYLRETLPPEVEYTKIVRAAATLAEACPEYFQQIG